MIGMATVPRPADVVTAVATVVHEADPAAALCRSIVRTAVRVPAFTETGILTVVATGARAEAVDHPVIVVVAPLMPVTTRAEEVHPAAMVVGATRTRYVHLPGPGTGTDNFVVPAASVDTMPTVAHDDVPYGARCTCTDLAR